MYSPLLALFSSLSAQLKEAAEDPSVDYKGFVLWFGGITWAFQSYLVLRQLPLYSRPPPSNLVAHITKEDLAKSQSYGRDKAVFSLFSLAWGQTLEFAVVYLDGFSKVWQVSQDLVGPVYTGGILHSLLYATLLTLMMYIPTIPLSLISTFVVEEKHGFNKSTLGLFLTDMLKGQLVVAVLGLPLLAGFLRIKIWAGDSFVGWLMLFLRVQAFLESFHTTVEDLVFQLAVTAIYPTFIQPLFNKFTALPEGPIREKVSALSKRLNFPLKHLYEIDGSKRSGHSNAYFYGLPWSKHIVIYDTLIEKSSPEEVEAVLAHELGHWAMSHPSKLLFLSQFHLLLTLTLLHLFLQNPILLQSFNFPSSATLNPPLIVAFLLSQLIMAPIDQAFSLGLNFVTRRFEYQADRFACKLGAGMGEELGKALRKLHVNNLATVNTDWLYSAYHHSHPTLPERLRAIDDFVADYYDANKHLKLRKDVVKLE